MGLALGRHPTLPSSLEATLGNGMTGERRRRPALAIRSSCLAASALATAGAKRRPMGAAFLLSQTSGV